MAEPSSPSAPRSGLRLIGGIVYGFVVILLVVIVEHVGELPKTLWGWIAFAILAPPLYLFGEWFFEKLSEEPATPFRRVVKAILVFLLALVGTAFYLIIALSNA